MASAQQYAEWILANQDKKGTPDFETVAVAYRQLRGIAAPELPEPDFLDQIEEFGKGIPRGIIGLAEQAALGGASILTEEAEEGVRESILDTAGSAREYFAPDRGSEDTVGGKFGEAVGSFAGLGLASLIPGIGMPLAGGLAVGAGAGEARERSRAADATEGERGFATALGAVVGLSELIPIKVLGALRKDVDDSVVKQILGRVKRAGIAGGAEGAQEMAAGIAQNLIEKGVYNPEQGVFTGSGEAFGYGAGVGGLVQGLLDLALPKSRGRGDVDPEEVTEESVEETLQLGYDPSAEIIFEDGSVLRGNRETIEEAGYDFDEARQNTEFRAIAKAKQQEALAAEEARIAAIPDYLAGAVPGVPDAVVDDASTEASIIFEEQAKKKAEADKKMPMVVDQPESPDFVTTPEGETLSAQQFKNKELEDQVAAQVAALEAEIVSGDQPAPQVLQQKQLADETQALGAAKAELAGRPQTDLFPTQLTTAEAQAARQPAPEPAPEPAQKISQKFLKDIGIAPTDTRTRKTKPIYQRLMAKKEVPLAELNAELKAYVDNPDVKDAPTKAKINEFLGVPQNKQIELAFEGTETVTPTETTETEKTAETVKEVTTSSSTTAEKSATEEAKEDTGTTPKKFDMKSLEGLSITEQLKVLEGRGAPTEFTPAAVVDGQLELEGSISEADLEQQGEQRRFVNQVSRDMQRQELDTKPLTIGERAEAVMKSPLGIEPALANVPPEYRKQVTAAVETERTIREAMAQKTADEKAVKQRKANAAVTEGAKDKKTKVPELSGTAQKRKRKGAGPVVSYAKQIIDQAAKYQRQANKVTFDTDASKTTDIKLGSEKVGTVKKVGKQWQVRVGEETKSFTNKSQISKYLNKESKAINTKRLAVITSSANQAITELAPIQKINEELEAYAPNVNMDIDIPLADSVVEQLEAGNLKGALEALGTSDLRPRVKAIARALATLVGDTKIVIVSRDPSTPADRQYRSILDSLAEGDLEAAGVYIPTGGVGDSVPRPGIQKDVILLDAEIGLTPANLLHEMAHAATLITMRNPSNPTTKQLTALFEAVKPHLSGARGATNVEEFVAEAFGNARFAQELATINIQGEPASAWQKFTNIIGNFIRRLRGLDPVRLEIVEDAETGTALSEADRLIGDILAPAIDARGAGSLLENSSASGVAAVMRKMGNVQKDFKAPTKKFREDFVNQADKFLRSGVSGKTRRAFLGFSPSQALADIAGSYNKKLGDLGQRLHRLMEEQRGELNKKDNAADGTMKQVDEWAKNNQAAVPLLDDVITESTLEGVDPSKPISTYEKNAAKLAIWKGLQPKWNKLKESGGQDIYVGMRDSYAKLYKELIAVINKRIDGLDVDKENKEKLRKSVFDKITDRAGTDPYFPLMRSGDYKLSFQAYNEATDSTEPVFLMFDSPRERDKYVKNELENNDTVERDGEGALVYSEYDGNDSPTYKKTTSASFVNEVLEILETAKVDAAVRNQILNSFIETLPETSFAKNFQRREGVAGFDQDHIRVMRSKIYDIGRQVTRLDYTNRITKMQQQILGTDPDNLDGTLAGLKNREGTLKDIQAELEARAEFAMRPPKDGFAQSANRAAFIWTIGFNTSSALVNLSQVPLFVLPMLGGKHGFRSASKAITEAAGLVSGTLLSSKTRSRRIRGIVPFGKNDTVDAFAMPSMDNLFEMDEAGNYTVRKDIEGYAERRKELEEILPLVQLAAERGQLNRSLFADSLGLDSSGRDKSVIDRISGWSAFMFHQVEQYNRQVTMLAAYRLELARINDPKRATKAEQAMSTAKKRELAAQNSLFEAQQLNGGSVLETAPRFAQKGIGRVALMYKTYGIQMYYTMIKTAVAGLRRENDPEVRKAALRQLVAVHGSALFFAGVQGLPLFGAFTMIANLFLDEDEDDAETIVRKHIGEGWYKGALTELLDVDVSQRVALTNLLFQVNRYNRDASPEETIGYYLGGPAWSVGKSFIRGTGELINGDMERGIEAMVPGAVRNGLKAIRYTEEGALTRRKDPILDDITGGQLVSQVIGFAPAEYARRQEENQGVKRIENTLRTNRGKLLKQYYLAMRMGDYEEARDVKQDILDFNKRVSRKFPKAIITSDSVARSMRSHMRTSATMHNGIAISPMFRTALQEHLDDSTPITLED
jgi:hypothetical protein